MKLLPFIYNQFKLIYLVEIELAKKDIDLRNLTPQKNGATHKDARSRSSGHAPVSSNF
jgi:hypothetical protein